MTFKAGSSPRTFFSNASALIRTMASCAWLSSVSRSSEAEGSAFMMRCVACRRWFSMRSETEALHRGRVGQVGGERELGCSMVQHKFFEPIGAAARRKEAGSSSEHGGLIPRLPDSGRKRNDPRDLLPSRGQLMRRFGMHLLRFRCKTAT